MNEGNAHTVHGDRDVHELEALGLRDVTLLDFAVNLNPFGPPPRLLAALREADLSGYPERTSLAARSALANIFATTSAHVALGNGACELLWSLAQLWRGGTALMVEPTFSEFAAAMHAHGGKVLRFMTSEDAEFEPDHAALSRAITQHRPDAVYLCNPNNPTGGFTPLDHVAELARAHQGTHFVIDESFLSLSDHAACLHQPLAAANIVRLRSLTKDFAIAGVRVGYALGDPNLLTGLEAVRPPWTVSRLAQAAVEACLREEAFLHASRSQLADLRQLLTRGLTELGLRVTPSCVNFVLVNVAREAAALRVRLLRQHHVVVRDCASFGLPQHLRLCVRPEADIARLLAALRESLA